MEDEQNYKNLSNEELNDIILNCKIESVSYIHASKEIFKRKQIKENN